MNYKEYGVTYSISSHHLQDVLVKLNSKRTFSNSLLGKKLFTGVIKNYEVDVLTFDAPPMRVLGTIENVTQGSQLKLRIEYDSLKNSIKGLWLVLLYCIEFVLILSYLKAYGFNLLIIPLFIIGIILPIVVFKIYWFLDGHEPNPDFFIETLEKK